MSRNDYARTRCVPAWLSLALLASCTPAPAQQPGPAVANAPQASASGAAVTARGRLEPHGGVVRVAGPSDFAVVVARLDVAEGDRVEAGQLLAVTDTHAVRRAQAASLRARVDAQQDTIARLEAVLENARLERERRVALAGQGVVAASERDAAEARLLAAQASVAEARAQLVSARAELAMAEAQAELGLVRAPRAGQVLKLHARAGERVGPDGILDLGATHQMDAIAEVYESDVGRVRLGQRARVRSPALPRELEGTVVRVGLEVGRLSSTGDDPALRADARVVEVEIRLDDGAAAAAFTYLEVDVLIGG